MSDEPSNITSEGMRKALALLTEAGSPSEEWLRAGLTDDFVYEDRRSGLSFPDADAESFPNSVLSMWQTGADGQPRFEPKTLAVRGERFAAATIQLDFGNGMLIESVHLLALDPNLALVQHVVDFDIDDIDGAIAELDRLHSQADAS